ncbi:MAG: AarF/UbiB family protein [Pseudomonadota bacterium]
MSKKSGIRRGSFGRGLAVSLAGLRAGGAFAVGTAVQRITGKSESEPEGNALLKREAQRFTAELGRLKGSYVKIGQMLALLGEHFLPKELTEALHQLESQTQPIPWSELEPSVRASLGGRYRQVDVEEQALAAASLAQVHRVRRLVDGKEMVFKVQYPDLAEVIDDDFDAVIRMLLLARWIKGGRELDEWLRDMRLQLHHEIDYSRELAMTRDAKQRLETQRGDSRYYVPEVFDTLCSENVLALEFVEGYRVNATEVAALSQRRRNALGEAMLELFFLELYEWGVLQTDPNFGNYLIKTADGSQARGKRSQDQLVLLDFGSTMECDDQFRRHFGNAIAAGQIDDQDMLIESLVGLGCLRADASDFAKESFAEFCRMLLEPLRPVRDLPKEHLNAQGHYRWGQSNLIQRVGKHAASSAATRHFVTPSREFALIVRKLTGVFTFITVLNAEFNGHDLVQRYISDWIGPDSQAANG